MPQETPKKTNRDYPLATSPEPIYSFQGQASRDMDVRTLRSAAEQADKRRNAQKEAEKANDAYREKAMKENRDKKSQMSPEELRQAAQR
jgi:hypothetical protein